MTNHELTARRGENLLKRSVFGSARSMTRRAPTTRSHQSRQSPPIGIIVFAIDQHYHPMIVDRKFRSHNAALS